MRTWAAAFLCCLVAAAIVGIGIDAAAGGTVTRFTSGSWEELRADALAIARGEAAPVAWLYGVVSTSSDSVAPSPAPTVAAEVSSSSTGVAIVQRLPPSTATPADPLAGFTCKDVSNMLEVASSISEALRSSGGHFINASSINNDRAYLAEAHSKGCALSDALLSRYARDAALDYLSEGPLPQDLQNILVPATEAWVLQTDPAGEYQAIVQMQQVAFAYEASRHAVGSGSAANYHDWELACLRYAPDPSQC